MHPKVKQAFEEIDAALFNGDTFDAPEAFEHLEWMVERWIRATSREDRSRFRKRVFGDLEIGARFILFPSSGENSGHGGYLGGAYLWKKTAGMLAAREQIDQVSSFQLDVRVIEVLP